jgi:signal peptidase II
MWYLLVAAALVALDQIVKYWIRTTLAVGESMAFLPHVCQLTYVQNRGAAFSSMQGMRWFFVVITLAFVAVALWYLLSGRIHHAFGRWALVVVLGGAVGNLIDRALFGYVVDMFDVLFMNFAVFNVADIFVVCGGIAFCIYLAFFSDAFDEDKKRGTQA